MPINTPSFAYPFDPKAELTSNLIVNEQHIISAIQGKHYQKIVPRWAPFYQKDLRLRFRAPNGQVRDLIEGQDYYLGHRFLSASRSTGYPIYGSINIIDRSLQGTVVIDQYRTLGGSWTIDQPQIMKILADQLYNPRIVTWEFVIERPINFPVTAHEWDIADMKGATHVVEALGGVRDALYQRNSDVMTEHIQDRNNPHGVTAAQINAVTTDVFEYELNLKLDKTATAVNSAKLEGRDVETLTQEILSGTAYNTQHLDGKNLNQVREYILKGKAADAERYNGMNLEQFDTYIRERLGEMTIVDVTATNTERFAGRNWTQAQTEIRNGTVANATNFNNRTDIEYYTFIKDRLAMENSVEVTVTDSLKLEGLTLDQVIAQTLLGTVADSDRFAGMSLAEFEIHLNDIIANLGELPGTAANSLRLENQTLADILELVKSQGVENAIKFNGNTWDEAVEIILGGQAYDSQHLEGESLEDIIQTSVVVTKLEGGLVSAMNYFVPRRAGSRTITILPVGSALLLDPSDTDVNLINSISRIEIELRLAAEAHSLPAGNYSRWAITTHGDRTCRAELLGGTRPTFQYSFHRDDRPANVTDYVDEDGKRWKQYNYYMAVYQENDAWLSVKTQSGLIEDMPTDVLPSAQLSSLTTISSIDVSENIYSYRTVEGILTDSTPWSPESILDTQGNPIKEDIVGPIMYMNSDLAWSTIPNSPDDAVSVVEDGGVFTVKRVGTSMGEVTIKMHLQVSRRV